MLRSHPWVCKMVYLFGPDKTFKERLYIYIYIYIIIFVFTIDLLVVSYKYHIVLFHVHTFG
jgi:hypothetical protein